MTKNNPLPIRATAFVFALASLAVLRGQERPEATLENGDINGDGVRNVVDVVSYLDFLFRDGREPEVVWCRLVPQDPIPCDLDAEASGIVTRPVVSHLDETRVGSAWLSRNARGITAMVHTTGLPVGHAVTAWWVIFNNPEACVSENGCRGYNGDVQREGVKGDILFADGFVVTEKEQVFGAFREVGDVSGSFGMQLRSVPPTGLLHPLRADVHLVLRSHGPVPPDVDAETLELMLTTVHGGCRVKLPKGEMPDEVGECADIQAVQFEIPREPYPAAQD